MCILLKLRLTFLCNTELIFLTFTFKTIVVHLNHDITLLYCNNKYPGI